MADLSKLSLKQLQSRLQKLETEWYELEQAIADKEKGDKLEFAEIIRQKVQESGHDLADIMALVVPRSRRGKTGGNRSYTTYADPDNPNHTYVRGPLPAWLKEKMRAAGVDTGNKQEREAFKQHHLKKKSH